MGCFSPNDRANFMVLEVFSPNPASYFGLFWWFLEGIVPKWWWIWDVCWFFVNVLSLFGPIPDPDFFCLRTVAQNDPMKDEPKMSNVLGLEVSAWI